MNEPLWAHIHGTPNGDVSEVIFSLDRESKICKFEGIMCEKDIGGFDISVDDSFRC